MVSDGPLAGFLRVGLPPLRRGRGGGQSTRQRSPLPGAPPGGGGNTRVAMHNLESTTALLRYELMREGVLREAGPEPVEVAYDEAVELYEG